MSRAAALIRWPSSSCRGWQVSQPRADRPLTPLVQAAELLAMRAGAVQPLTMVDKSAFTPICLTIPLGLLTLPFQRSAYSSF